MKACRDVVLIGTDAFACPTLRLLHELRGVVFDRLAVAVPDDRPRGRGQKVQPGALRRYANQLGYETIQGPTRATTDWDCGVTRPEVALVVDYGHFIPPAVIQMFPVAALNAHPSLLPRLRGPTPIQTAILQGLRVTGVSIIELSPKAFDFGRIVDQEKVEINDFEFYESLSTRLSAVASKLFHRVLSSIAAHGYNPQSQDDSISSCTSKITRAMACIQWGEWDAERIYSVHRAIGYKYPLYTALEGESVQFLDVSLHCAPPRNFTRAGKAYMFDGNLIVDCSPLSSLVIKSLRFASRRVITQVDFANAYLGRGHGQEVYFSTPI